MLSITIKGIEYNLATTLRVAYEVQGQHNHKPYADVFKEIGEMGVEQQIDIVFAAFKCANPEAVDVKAQGTENAITKAVFRDYMLDNYNLGELMDLLQGVIQGIMGDKAPKIGGGEDADASATDTEDETEGN